MLDNRTLIGVDLGGTKVLAARIANGAIADSHKLNVPKAGSKEDVLKVIYQVIDACMDDSVTAIGCGVPSVVDVDEGIVYDVQNIPSWNEVPLKSILESKYDIPVHINNDANCYALGECYFGKGKEYDSFMGLIVGTGMAAGIIVHGKLYSGHNCGAGEFGMIPYLDHYFEYYSSGQFFENVHNRSGAEIYANALEGDAQALKIYQEYGHHLGNAICAMLYAMDPEVIILGGSVSQAYAYFQETMWESIRTIAYRSIPERLKIIISEDKDIPVKGAAALCYDALIGINQK